MLNIVILAAGMGKRMQSTLPKVLHKIAGQPMLTHLLRTAQTLSPDRLMVVIGHGAETIRQAYKNADAGLDANSIHFVLQTEQLGTGHAVGQTSDQLLGDDKNSLTMVLYGDVPLVQAETLNKLQAAANQGLALLTETLSDPTGYGRIVRNAQGHVTSIVEQKDASDAQRLIQEVNTGMLVAQTTQLKKWLQSLNNQNAQGEYYLTDIVAMAVAQGITIQTVQPQAPYETLGVNSRAQQAALERLWQAELARRQLEAGVTLIDPNRFDVRGTLSCGRDVTIDVGCVFEGDVQLADGVSVGPHCVLQDVLIGPGTRIEAYSHLSHAQVGAEARIGPYARLRPGSVLGNRSHVGNFVEIKNTQLGEDSKVNHLAYVGDADIGQRVNIGAGTITCNYDGVNKYRTTIEDDAFIGSDTQLVAPVRVGAGATIGAGTTLTDDAAPNSLTLSRTKQVTLSNWQRPVKKK
jgi:bifunctional UDP-N-acetylglucosamine pyrophosphorylase/glucosamine-1-phosphate N-acetyltransferase